MNFKWCVVAAAAAVGAGGWTATAQAAPTIRYDFTATVSKIIDNTNFSLNGTIPIGTAVAGSFTYDAGVAGVPNGPTATNYAGGALSFSVNIGGGLLIWNSGPLNFFNPQVIVLNDDPTFGDLFESVGGEAPATGVTLPAGATTAGPPPFGLIGYLILTDPTHTAFTDQSIPTSLDFSKFGSGEFDFNGGAASGDSVGLPGSVYTTLTSLRVSTDVPEPEVLALLGSGLLALGLARRRTLRGADRRSIAGA